VTTTNNNTEVVAVSENQAKKGVAAATRAQAPAKIRIGNVVAAEDGRANVIGLMTVWLLQTIPSNVMMTLITSVLITGVIGIVVKARPLQTIAVTIAEDAEVVSAVRKNTITDLPVQVRRKRKALHAKDISEITAGRRRIETERKKKNGMTEELT
jgi:hypothetical protein